MITSQDLSQELVEWAIKDAGKSFRHLPDAAYHIYEYLIDNGVLNLMTGEEVHYVDSFCDEGPHVQEGNCWIVISFEDQFFQLSGEYNSWGDTSLVSWEGTSLQEVEAREVSIIQYFPKIS